MADLTVSNIPDVVQFVSGTKQYFYQAAAPTGWTIDTTLGDAVLAVHGSSSYNGSGSGGVQAGTWTQPDHTHGPGNLSGPVPLGGYAGVPDAVGVWDLLQTNNTGNFTRATASPTLTLNGGVSDGDATTSTWRPFANVGIIASKD